ncbi:MAG: DUF4399 domain-containing protein [Chloroflexi bacterium]|nr:DUF4399 domain-containing protein [Chloroflexota bacterium]
MKRHVSMWAVLLLTSITACATAPVPLASPTNTPSIQQAPTVTSSVKVVSPADGSTIGNPLIVKMAVAGLQIIPAATPSGPGQGHLHVLVDVDTPPVGQAIPKDDSHFHLGDGKDELTLKELTPGNHKLTAVFANSNHVVVSPLLVHTINITVSAPKSSVDPGSDTVVPADSDSHGHSAAPSTVSKEATVFQDAASPLTNPVPAQAPPPAPVRKPSNALIEQKATTTSYRFEVLVGPIPITSSLADAATAHSGHIMLQGEPVISMAGLPPNLHLDLYVYDLTTGALVTNREVVIRIVDEQTKNLLYVPAATLYDAAIGKSDLHYGNDVALRPGTYGVYVNVGAQENALQIQGSGSATAYTGGEPHIFQISIPGS